MRELALAVLGELGNERDRSLITGYYIEGLSKPELMQRMMLNADQFDRVISRARGRMRERLLAEMNGQPAAMRGSAPSGPLSPRTKGAVMNPLEGFLLKAYLDGELDNEAAEAIELLLIERPDIAELVDADSALRIGLGQATAASVTPAPSPVATAPAAVIEQAGQAQRIPAVAADARFGRRRSFLYSPALAAGVICWRSGWVLVTSPADP